MHSLLPITSTGGIEQAGGCNGGRGLVSRSPLRQRFQDAEPLALAVSGPVMLVLIYKSLFQLPIPLPQCWIGTQRITKV